MKEKCEVRNGAQKLNCMPILFVLFFFSFEEEEGGLFQCIVYLVF